MSEGIVSGILYLLTLVFSFAIHKVFEVDFGAVAAALCLLLASIAYVKAELNRSLIVSMLSAATPKPNLRVVKENENE
jgi:hypothetical protein